MKAYQVYKDSGYDWIGEIPDHWRIGKLKYFSHINPSKNADLLSKESDNLVTFLPMEKVNGDGTYDVSLKRPIKELWSGFTYFEENDVIVAKITPCFENGKGALLKNLDGQIGFGSTEFHVLRALPEISHPKFLYYLTQSHLFKTTGEAFMYGAAGQKRVPTNHVTDFPFSCPSLPEQQVIADFLDCKTAQIDTLIEKKQRQIDLLQEQRTALINHAVTKGLNPDAPMKDSRVEWLDEIPSHWEVVKLKYISPEITVGIVITPAKYYVDKGIPCLRSLNVKERRLVAEDLVYISSESNELLQKSKIYSGDLVSVRTGQPGTTAVVDERFDGANCIDLIITRQSEKFDSRFLAYQLNSKLSKAQYTSGSAGAIQQHFNVETAKNMSIVMPPIDEQISIREKLDLMTNQDNSVVKNIEAMIQYLQEYRTALISEAVTGKIDVRTETIHE